MSLNMSDELDSLWREFSWDGDAAVAEVARLRAEIAALKAGKWAGRWAEPKPGVWTRSRIVNHAIVDHVGSGWRWLVVSNDLWRTGVCINAATARSQADAELIGSGWWLESDDASPVPASKEGE